mmetsp:Transcript_7335/g.10238  ORF Transcript_7335/g.10238 Transcript_7335/m.10238 type:complete len:122 (-) Transcript_7335:177-542(-)
MRRNRGLFFGTLLLLACIEMFDASVLTFFHTGGAKGQGSSPQLTGRGVGLMAGKGTAKRRLEDSMKRRALAKEQFDAAAFAAAGAVGLSLGVIAGWFYGQRQAPKEAASAEKDSPTAVSPS